MGAKVCKIQESQKGKVFVITGCNTGIGKETAKYIASLEGTIILANRSYERSKELLDYITDNFPQTKPDFIKLDLSDLDSVMEFSKVFKSKYNRLDVLLNNAGVMMFPERQETKQGFEMQLGVNYLGHFVLTNQLLLIIKNTPKSRIINVSSMGHKGLGLRQGKIWYDDINFEKKYDDQLTYYQSKLANILFTKKLQKLLKDQNYDIKVVSLHPGIIATDLFRNVDTGKKCNLTKIMTFVGRPFLVTPVQGAQTNIYCSLEKLEKLVDGAYYSDLKVAKSSKISYDSKEADKLWDVSNKLVKNYLINW